MHSFLIAAGLLALTFALPANAQYGANVGWISDPITAPADPSLLARAYGGVGLAQAGPSGFLLNPAHVAATALGVSLSAPLARLDYPRYPEGEASITSFASSGAVALGAWRLGAGVGTTSFARGQVEAQPVFDQGGSQVGVAPGGDIGERGLVLAGGAQYVGRVSMGLGIAARRTSYYGPYFSEDPASWGVDVGVLLAADAIEAAPEGGLSLRFGLGYALQNAAGEMEGQLLPYESSTPPEPVDVRTPSDRYARLGWSATLGFDGLLKGKALRLVDATLTLDASHSLLRFDVVEGGDGTSRLEGAYSGPAGRIRLLDALLGRGRAPQGDRFGYYDEDTSEPPYRPGVTGHRSLTLAVLETLDLTVGTHSDPVNGPDGHTAVSLGGGLRMAGLVRSGLLGRPPAGLLALAERGELDLRFARYAIYGEGDSFIFENDVDQPWTLGATLSVAWP